MADEDQNQNNENQEQQTAAKKPGFLNVKNIIILSVMLVLLGVGAFIGIGMLTKKDDSKSKVKKVKKAELGKIYEFEPLIVNVAGTHGTRYLKVVVGLEYSAKNEKLSTEIQDRKVQFLDIMNALFSSRNMEQIYDIQERSSIKRDIRDKFNALLINGQITNVYFSDFVVQ